ncbi:L domain-like protein [Fragilariopsis cylindrus CCMP1102]|uniref:L domain-like protein n=1 Tax=Fragilariopsis cylindrus CCMP1102 TaxID=635003 RepID=A0A1E7FBL2_9STRA|nr:L domain-like protein [Fragilariopsis cylindrus CCMP1102]|eukprot:OEU15539.1 L domain-like protein [Fragilariopsis cylindrus CCMP1102]
MEYFSEKKADVEAASFPEPSLAAADSLALSLKEEVYVEHILPSEDEIAKEEEKKYIRKKRIARICCISSCIGLLIGIIVLAVMLTKHKKIKEDDFERGIVVNDGSGIGSIESIETNVETNVDEATSVEASKDGDNIFIAESLPELYYLLESKVYNATALLDLDTPEGKAYNFLLEEEEIKKNSLVLRSINDIDLERYALLVFYFGSDGSAWTNTAGWSNPSEACENWYGVTCQDSLVTGIDLDRNNLYGEISEDFCLMNNLKKIRLSDNEVKLPSCFSKLSNLEELDYRGNNYDGELPNDLHSMSSLTYLQLSDNVFTGSLDALFPADASDQPIFPNLITLNLANNDLSGQIPESRLRRMPNLKQLILHGNPDLSGSLNEMCKGDVISQIDVDCDKISCKCCQSGNNCPSSR